MLRALSICAALALTLTAARAHDLLAISYSTGELFAVDTATGALTALGSSAPSRAVGLEFAPDGTLWLVRDGHVPTVSELDPATGGALSTLSVGLALVHEGDLAFSPLGVAYVASEANSGVQQLFRLDLQTGLATIVGSLGAGSDVNGLAWRADGMLLALDANAQALLVVDPQSAQVVASFPVGVAIGRVSGMTCRGSVGYFSTASPNASLPGSSELVRFDPFSGAQQVIAALPVLSGEGISGLAWRVGAGPEAYCTSATSINGCVPALSAFGQASASFTTPFALAANAVDGQRAGLVFYGVLGRAAVPWASGSASTLCVRPPLQRTPVQTSGGTFLSCDGALALDWNAYHAQHPSALGAPFVAGSVLDAQGWYRDPGAAKSTALSNALEFVLAP